MRVKQASTRLASAFAVGILLTAGPLSGHTYAQPSAPSSGVSETMIKSLQQALAAQGFPVPVSGILDGATRAAVRTYQSQHHLSVTGDPDKATLDKLGVASGTTSAQSSSLAQTTPQGQVQMQHGQMLGKMMNAPMMHMMQGMMRMMQSQMQPAQTQPSQMSGGMIMNCSTMPENIGGMMQMMQNHMQGDGQAPGQTLPKSHQ